LEELENISVVVVDRKWMANKSWRIYLRLPIDRPLLPVIFSRLITENVYVSIMHPDAFIEIKPANIVNVPPYKGKTFLLVVETCYETQNAQVGPKITSIYGQDALLTVRELSAIESREHVPQKEPKETKSELPESMKTALMGLHRLFDNPKFQRFIQEQTSTVITNKDECKTAFKQLTGVESCRDIPEMKIEAWRLEFNSRLSRGPL
jgi:hypothetical protein